MQIREEVGAQLCVGLGPYRTVVELIGPSGPPRTGKVSGYLSSPESPMTNLLVVHNRVRALDALGEHVWRDH